jgi:GcrA cell cycle regulator
MPGHTPLHPPSGWTTERISKLIELHNQGLTASQVGKLMGVSRNAVIGKVSRLRHAGVPALKLKPPAAPTVKKKYESFFGW